MEGPFGNLILQIQEKIKEAVPEIREVAEDKGQIDAYENRPAVSFPCLLIDFDFKFDDMGENTQMGEGAVIIRLAFPPYSSSSSLMPVEVREKGMAYLDYELKVYQALQGWQPLSDPAADGFAFKALSRRTAVTEKRNDPIRVRQIRYDTALEDATAQDIYAKAHIDDVQISGELVEDMNVPVVYD